MPQVPNILWICTDQQRWDTLGCYGNPWVHTPNLDRLAAQGVRFDQCICNSTVCMPSRGSFLTGRYPQHTGMTDNGQTIHDKLLPWLLPRRLRDEAGYYAALAGKLHIRQPACLALKRVTDEATFDHGYSQVAWSPMTQPANWPGCAYQQWLREHGRKADARNHPDCSYIQLGVDAEYHQTTWCVRQAINFIQTVADIAPEDAPPWLFSCNLYDPHYPFDPPASMIERYFECLEDLPLPDRSEHDVDQMPKKFRPFTEQVGDMLGLYHPRAMCDRDHRYLRAAYLAMIDLIDQQVGRLLDVLEACGMRENTLIVFMSDHGEMLGDRGLYLKGDFMYEPAVRVPLIISQPGLIEAGRVSNALVELVDLAPTLGDAAGLTPDPDADGQSWWPWLTGEQANPPEKSSQFCQRIGRNGDHAVFMLRTTEYKLVVHQGHENRNEFYHLQSAQGESFNRWEDPAFIDVRQSMLKELLRRGAPASLPEYITDTPAIP